MNRSIIILIMLLPVLYISCSKERQLRNSFIGKVWVIDSIKSKSVDNLVKQEGGKSAYKGSLNNILKPVENGKFSIYQDQAPFFSVFKISNDTLYLKDRNSGKFEPFKFERVNEYTSKLKALNKNVDEYEYYITDLTDLFQKKVYNKGKLYNLIVDKTWYPIESWKRGRLRFNTPQPQFYTQENAFKINKSNLIYTHGFGEGTIVKITDKGIYLLDSKDNSLFVLESRFEDNYLELRDNSLNFIVTKFREIDENILISEKDLPKNFRLNCNEFTAQYALSNWLNQNVDSSFYYDIKTIKIENYINEECRYFFSVVYRSREFSDIYSTQRFVVYYTDDGSIKMEAQR